MAKELFQLGSYAKLLVQQKYDAAGQREIYDRYIDDITTYSEINANGELMLFAILKPNTKDLPIEIAVLSNMEIIDPQGRKIGRLFLKYQKTWLDRAMNQVSLFLHRGFTRSRERKLAKLQKLQELPENQPKLNE